MATITYGDHSVEVDAIPPHVVNKMLLSAFGHIMSNEVSSAVIGKIRGELAGPNGKRADVTTEMVKEFRENEQNESVIAGWEKDLRAAKLKAILDGTIGVSVARAPSRDPIEAAMRTIAKMEVANVLKANGAKFPKADETISIGDQEVTGDELVDRRLAHEEHGPRIRKAAERKVAEDRRLKEGAAKAATGGELSALL